MSHQVVIARHAFRAEGEGELSTSPGQRFFLVVGTSSSAEAPPPGWLLVRDEATGRTGYVPRDFVVPENDLPQQQQQSRTSIALSPAMQLHYQQQTFHAEEEENSASTAWARRDAMCGGGGALQFRTPLVAERRWHYRDLFGDMQGPFNEQEMRARVDARHVQADTACVVEVCSPAVAASSSSSQQQYEERRLRELFASAEAAFMVPARMTTPSGGGGGEGRFWYFQPAAAAPSPCGPFSTEQMRYWFEREGYFGSTSPVRDAQEADGCWLALGKVYADPALCFPPNRASSAAGPAQPQPPLLLQQQQRRSSRALLHHALQGGDEAKSDVAASTNNNDDEDDTLALFDKIELETTQATTTTTQQPVKAYGPASYAWPAWRGVPQPSHTSHKFPANVYAFVTRPLNPQAGRILTHIVRDVEGVMSMHYDTFRMYLENENGAKLTLVASRHHTLTGATQFDIKLVAHDDQPPLLVAKLDVNFMGTHFNLHNDVPGHVGVPKDLLCVLYEPNRMSGSAGGPRKMRVAVPDLDDGGEFHVFRRSTGSGSNGSHLQNSLTSAYAAAATSRTRCITMINKPPKWNVQRGAYALDFGGRVKRASVKNFQLVDPVRDTDHASVLLQHGRVSDDKFTMDVSHPLSLLQAFAVCLSSLHHKKAVD